MCKHKTNFEIIEIMNASHLRRAVGGEPGDIDKDGKPFGYNEIEDIRYYIFRCSDCNMEKRFPSLSTEKPLFVKNAIAILFP